MFDLFGSKKKKKLVERNERLTSEIDFAQSECTALRIANRELSNDNAALKEENERLRKENESLLTVEGKGRVIIDISEDLQTITPAFRYDSDAMYEALILGRVIQEGTSEFKNQNTELGLLILAADGLEQLVDAFTTNMDGSNE